MLTLSRISYFNSAEITALWRKAGSATAIMDNCRNICDLMPDCNRRTAEALADTAEAEARAESEIEFASWNLHNSPQNAQNSTLFAINFQFLQLYAAYATMYTR